MGSDSQGASASGERHDPADTVEEFRDAAALVEGIRGVDPETAEVIEALLEEGKRFQRLWIDTHESLREVHVIPLAKELDRVRGLLATDSVERMEEALRLHYKEPVRPVSAYCNAFTLWFWALRDAKERGDLDEQLTGVLDAVDGSGLELAIRKSCLLNRLIYMGEGLREEMCPEHRGRWSGYAGPRNECPHGCSLGSYDITGWLPLTPGPEPKVEAS